MRRCEIRRLGPHLEGEGGDGGGGRGGSKGGGGGGRGPTEKKQEKDCGSEVDTAGSNTSR